MTEPIGFEPMSEKEPQTEAGRALLRSDFDTTGWGPRVVRWNVHRAILAIETEARDKERETQVAVRKDWSTLPHGKFHEKYGTLARDLYLLPTNCTCPDCRMWSS